MKNIKTTQEEIDNLNNIINSNDKYKSNTKIINQLKKFNRAYSDFPLCNTLSMIDVANRDSLYHICEILLENNLSNVNDINLHYTVIQGKRKYFDLYIKYGVDINKDDAFLTSFNRDYLSQNTKMTSGYMFDNIINHPKFDINRTNLSIYHEKGKSTFLIKCAISGNAKQLNKIIEKMDSNLLNHRNEKGKSASYFVFEFGFMENIDSILKEKPTLNYLDLTRFKFENLFLLEDYGYLKDTNFISEWNKRNDYLIEKIEKIIKDIKEDKLNFLITGNNLDLNKTDLFDRIKTIDTIFYNECLKFYEEEIEITKEYSLSVLENMIKEIKKEKI